MKHTCQSPRQFRVSLISEARKIISPAQETLAEVTAAASTNEARQLRLDAIRAVLGKSDLPDKVEKLRGWLIPVSFSSQLHGFRPCKIGKDARIITTRAESRVEHTPSVPSRMDRRGQWGGFERAVSDNYFRSFALANGQTLHIAQHETESAITLPDGYSWDWDCSGIRIVRNSDGADFHPPYYEITNIHIPPPVERWLSVLGDNANTRAEAAARAERQKHQDALFLADLPTTRVMFCDSRRAGNCIVGTIAFAGKLKIAMETLLQSHFSVPAEKLIENANGDKDRVMMAIRVAWERETMISI